MQITPFLMFQGQAEEALNCYLSLFPDARVVAMQKYGPGEGGKEESVQLATFEINGQQFKCIDSPVQHAFTFTPALSLYVSSPQEAEVRKLFESLSDRGSVLMPLAAYPFSPLFGWVQDRFGVSWQLTLS